jgi:hypothetical protein
LCLGHWEEGNFPNVTASLASFISSSSTHFSYQAQRAICLLVLHFTILSSSFLLSMLTISEMDKGGKNGSAWGTQYVNTLPGGWWLLIWFIFHCY